MSIADARMTARRDPRALAELARSDAAPWPAMGCVIKACDPTPHPPPQSPTPQRPQRPHSQLRRFQPFYQRICTFHRASANVLSRTTEAGTEAPEMQNADVAQLVAHHLAKVRVAGSNPVIRSRGRARQCKQPSPFARWSGRVVRQRPAKPCTRVRFPSPPRAISSAGERFPDTEEVTGSIPVSRTISPSRAPFRGGPTCFRFRSPGASRQQFHPIHQLFDAGLFTT